MALCFACPGFAGTATRDRFHTQSVSRCKNSSGSATSPALSEESQGPLKRGLRSHKGNKKLSTQQLELLKLLAKFYFVPSFERQS